MYVTTCMQPKGLVSSLTGLLPGLSAVIGPQIIYVYMDIYDIYILYVYVYEYVYANVYMYVYDIYIYYKAHLIKIYGYQFSVNWDYLTQSKVPLL